MRVTSMRKDQTKKLVCAYPVPRMPKRESEEHSHKSGPMAEDFFTVALWFTREIQREYVGTPTIAIKH